MLNTDNNISKFGDTCCWPNVTPQQARDGHCSIFTNQEKIFYQQCTSRTAFICKGIAVQSYTLGVHCFM